MDVERLFREVDFSRNPEHKEALWRMLSQKRLQMERSKRLEETDVLTETELEAIAAGTGNATFPSPDKRNKKNI